MGGEALSSDSGSPTPSPLRISTFILCCHQHQLHSHGRSGWDGNRAEEGYAIWRARPLPTTRKAAWSYPRARKQGRTGTASGTAHLFNKCSLSWAMATLSHRKFKCFWPIGVSQAGQTPGAGQKPSLSSRRSQFRMGIAPQLQKALGTQ